MQRNRPPSPQANQVMRSLAAAPAEWRHGYDLCQETGIKAGTMYPILIRLADRGWLETSWEEGAPGGRPPRHLYRLTEAGMEAAREVLKARPAERGTTRKAAVAWQPRMGDAP